MKLFITGATGLIGRRVVLDRLQRGDQVVLLSRDAGHASTMFAAAANRNITIVQGNPAAPGDWQESVSGCDAVLHLAAASISDRRWSAAYKKIIATSRIDSTHQVASAIEMAPPSKRPSVFLLASGSGYYGDARDRELTEDSPAGSDFLGKLCVAWEAQAMRTAQLGIRVVALRVSAVLDERGGALPKMVRPFKLWLGGRLGSGKQYLPWIHWRDLIGLIDLALEEQELDGPLNVSAPQSVRQREFARILGQVLGRPSWLPAPRIALRAALGEVVKYILASQRVVPAKAMQRGYVFLYPELRPALEALLGNQQQEDNDDALADPILTTGGRPMPAASLVNLGPPPMGKEQSPAVTKPPAQPPAPVRLLAIDVDGTLLNSSGSLPQGVIDACRAAQRAGCTVVLATVRPPRGMRMILQALDLTGPTINYNGAVIWNPIEDKPQFHEPLAPETARQIIADVSELRRDLTINLEVLDRWYADRIDPRFFSEEGPLSEPDYVGPLDQFLQSPVTKLSVLGMPGHIEPALELIRERYWRPRNVAVFLTDPRLIQITHPMVDKGIALQRIARRMNLHREEVMAIGDAPNDMGMIEWAGFGVAVENAYPGVKEFADAIVPSNDELGVARAIQRYVLARR